LSKFSVIQKFEENKVYFILTKDGKEIVDSKVPCACGTVLGCGLNLKAECDYTVGLRNGKYGSLETYRDFNTTMPLNYKWL
jgi:hypothetical protein